MSAEQLRLANEKVRELRNDFRVHLDARGWFVTAEMAITTTGNAADAQKYQATIVEPKRTMVEALEWAYEVFQDMKAGKVESFYSDRHLRGQSLDIAPPYTESQRARIEREKAAAKLGAEKQNEAIRKQLHYLWKRAGLFNIEKVRKAFK